MIALHVFVAFAYAVVMLTALAITSRGRNDHRRAEEKGLSLLRSWLTTDQAQQWDCRRHFDVIGSDTGTRYRIRYGAAMNIDQLNSDGKLVAQWCFAPQGNLVVGDVMLAQKIALETMEGDALSKANRNSLVNPLRATAAQSCLQ
jgi:hypothetical protein